MSDTSANSPVGAIAALGGVLLFAWLWTQWTHELGHVAAGFLTGADIDGLVLDPRSFSQTLFDANPRPLLTVWAGPIVGVLVGTGLPLLVAYAFPNWKGPLQIVAAFVFLANGLYIGLGPAMAVGDARDMIRLGTPQWAMIPFGFVCMVAARTAVAPLIARSLPLPERRHALAALGAAAVLAAVGLLLFPR